LRGFFTSGSGYVIAPKGEHSYLLQNLFGRVSMSGITYLIDGLQTEASLQNLKMASCTYSLAIERLSAPPNPKIAVRKVVPAIQRLAGGFYNLEEALEEVTFHENLARDIVAHNNALRDILSKIANTNAAMPRQIPAHVRILVLTLYQ
jgi:hypothetical protein